MLEGFDFFPAVNAQAPERAGHPLVKHVLELVPGTGCPLANFANPVFHGTDLLAHHTTGFRFQLFAFLDQAVEKFTGVFLGLGVGAQPGQPDLTGRALDFVCQLRIILRRILVLVGHSYLLNAGKGCSAPIVLQLYRDFSVTLRRPETSMEEGRSINTDPILKNVFKRNGRWLELLKLWSILPDTGIGDDAGVSGSLSWILLARLCPASLAGLFLLISHPVISLFQNQPFNPEILND